MANTKSTQHEVDLTSELNLNKFKVDIKNYNGFNSRNSPYYGGCLSPLYIKDEGTVSENTQYYNGHAYTVRPIEDTTQKGLYKDGTEIGRYARTGFVVQDINVEESGTLVDYYDTNAYIVDNGSNFTIKLGSNTLTKSGTYVDSRIYYDTGIHYAIVETQGIKVYLFRRSYNDGMTVSSWNLSGDDLLYKKNYINIRALQTGQILAQCNSALFWFVDSKIKKVSKTLSFTNLPSMSPLTVSGRGKIYPIIGRSLTGFIIPEVTAVTGTTPTAYYVVRLCPQSFNLSGGSVSLTSTGDNTAELNVVYNYAINNTGESKFYGITWKIGIGTPPDYEDIDVYINKNSLFPFMQAGLKAIKPNDADENVWGVPEFKNYGFNISYLTDTCMLHNRSVIMDYFATKQTHVYALNPYADNLPGPAGGTFVMLDSNNNWRVLADRSGIIQGISYTGAATSLNRTTSIGTLLTPWNSVSNEKNIYYNNGSVVYYDDFSFSWKKITIQNTNELRIIGDYAVVNTTSNTNSIDLSDGDAHHWAN